MKKTNPLSCFDPPKKIVSRIPNRIDEILAEKNINPNDLAKKLNVANNTVWSWRNNVNQPTLNKLVDISKALNCEITDLFHNKFKKEANKIKKKIEEDIKEKEEKERIKERYRFQQNMMKEIIKEREKINQHFIQKAQEPKEIDNSFYPYDTTADVPVVPISVKLPVLDKVPSEQIPSEQAEISEKEFLAINKLFLNYKKEVNKLKKKLKIDIKSVIKGTI